MLNNFTVSNEDKNMKPLNNSDNVNLLEIKNKKLLISKNSVFKEKINKLDNIYFGNTKYIYGIKTKMIILNIFTKRNYIK